MLNHIPESPPVLLVHFPTRSLPGTCISICNNEMNLKPNEGVVLQACDGALPPGLESVPQAAVAGHQPPAEGPQCGHCFPGAQSQGRRPQR